MPTPGGIGRGFGSQIHESGGMNVRNKPNPDLSPQPLPHINLTYGDNMAINAAFGGTPDLMYSENTGTGGGEWDATTITGSSWNFASAVSPQAGTVCISASSVISGDMMQLQDGGSLAGFVAISGWLRLTRWSEAKNNHLDIFGWDTLGGVIQGNSVRVEDYIDTAQLGNWQKFAIPLIDMGLESVSIDSLRFQAFTDPGAGISPIFSLDVLQIEETGGGVEFNTLFAQPPNTIYYATRLRTLFTGVMDVRQIPDAITGAVSSAPRIPVTDYFNVVGGLVNGITQRIKTNGVLGAAVTFKTLTDNFKLAESRPELVSYDVDTGIAAIFVDIEFAFPLTLDNTKGDFSIISISDDFSGMTLHTIYYMGSFENAN